MTRIGWILKCNIYGNLLADNGHLSTSLKTQLAHPAWSSKPTQLCSNQVTVALFIFCKLFLFLCINIIDKLQLPTSATRCVLATYAELKRSSNTYSTNLHLYTLLYTAFDIYAILFSSAQSFWRWMRLYVFHSHTTISTQELSSSDIRRNPLVWIWADFIYSNMIITTINNDAHWWQSFTNVCDD